MGTESDDARLLLEVVNPDVTAEEIAALVTVFAALGSAGPAAPKPTRPAWSRPARGVRRTHRSGAGGWRASGLPR